MSPKPTSAKSSATPRTCPLGSYGRRNRQAIAARETRIATRLRAVEQAYRSALERDQVPSTLESARIPRPPGHAVGMQIELEAEP